MPSKRPASSKPAPARRTRRAAEPRPAEDYYAQSFRLSPAVMLLARLPGAELIEVNDAFTRITGFQREEVLGHTTLELGVWVDRAQRDGFLKQMLATGKVREFEGEFITRAGERVWPLPLWDEYREMIKSDIADIKNIGGRPAGAITAGAFLAALGGGIARSWHRDAALVLLAQRRLPLPAAYRFLSESDWHSFACRLPSRTAFHRRTPAARRQPERPVHRVAPRPAVGQRGAQWCGCGDGTAITLIALYAALARAGGLKRPATCPWRLHAA